MASKCHGLNPGSVITSCVTWENYLTSLCLNIYMDKMQMKMTELLPGLNAILHVKVLHIVSVQ